MLILLIHAVIILVMCKINASDGEKVQAFSGHMHHAAGGEFVCERKASRTVTGISEQRIELHMQWIDIDQCQVSKGR